MIKFLAGFFAFSLTLLCARGSITIDWSSAVTNTPTADTFTVQQGDVLVTLSGLAGAGFEPTGPEVADNTTLASQIASSTPPILSSVNDVLSTNGIFSNANQPVTYTIQFLTSEQVSGVQLDFMNVTGLQDPYLSYFDIVDFGNQVPVVTQLGSDDSFAGGKLFGNEPVDYDYGLGAFSSVYYAGAIPNNTITFTVETSTPDYPYNFIDVGLGGLSYDPVPETTPLVISLGAVAIGALLMVRRIRRAA